MEPSPLERATRQFEVLPSVFTLTVMPTLPLCSPVDDSRQYSRSGILLIRRAGVKPD
jgi:hypothetical protein